MAQLTSIVAFLDREMAGGEFNDSSHNGLQVENAGRVTKICCGVDASLPFFEAAAKVGGDLLICHHGISWGESLARIRGLSYKRVAFLVKHDIALYGCHLPLDAHPKYGNNAVICRLLGLRRLDPFGIHGGKAVGLTGSLQRPMSYQAFKRLVGRKISPDLETMDFGPRTVRTVAVVSGGAAGDVDEAGRRGIDVFLSGEPALSAYNLAQEHKVNAVFAGHYATERFGVCALGALLSRRFRIPWKFIDMRIPY
jgi:dinuclear metal center YbgI/SA1388 family protein